MKVILLENIKKLGEKGDILEVSSGYAINFLIPNKKAVDYSSVKGKTINAEKNKKIEKKGKETEDLIGEFSKIPNVIDIKIKTNEKGHSYDSVTPSKIVEILKSENINIQKEWLDFENIKEAGEYEIKVSYNNKTRKVKLNITD